MAGETDQQVEQDLTPEQEAEMDREFEAAFNAARGDEPHAEGSTSPTLAPTEAPGNGEEPNGDQAAAEADAAAKAQADAEAAAKADADAKAKAEADAQAAQNAPVTLTQAELAALRATAARVDQLQDELKRTQDSTAGRFGSLKQTIDAVKAQAQNGQKPTLKQMKRLEAEFPELATMLKEDLEEAFGAAPAPVTDAGSDPEPTAAPTPAPTEAPAPVDPFTDQRVQKVLRQKEIAIVDAVHPDWRTLKATPEFNQWRATLPPAAQQLLANSWESKVLNDAFTDFKGWQKKRAEQAATANERNKRLERGTPATNGQPTGTNAVDDDAAFLAGFAKARGT